MNLVEGLASAAASRNYLSTLVGATGVVVALGVIDADTAKGVVDAAQQMMDGLGQVIGGAKKMYVLLLPAASIALAKYAGLSATLKNRLASITTDPKVKIEGQIVVPADVAAAIPSMKVVADPTTKVP